MTQCIQIKDLDFAVQNARFWGTASRDRCYWSLEIEAVPREIGLDFWEPTASIVEILPLTNKAWSSWRDLFGSPLVWDQCYDPLNSDTHGVLYVFGHYPIYNSKIRFDAVHDNGVIEVNWSALCDVNLDDDYYENLPLRILASAQFRGIEIEASTENEARSILRNYMPDNGFDFRRESDGGKCWLELNST